MHVALQVAASHVCMAHRTRRLFMALMNSLDIMMLQMMLEFTLSSDNFWAPTTMVMTMEVTSCTWRQTCSQVTYGNGQP
jgi:hypothetical protein